MTLSDTARIGELLDEAIEAVNQGDFTTAHDLAELVLLEDSTNLDAGELLAAEGSSNGELRRLTILCCDLVGSTELSERQEPERYRTLVRRYRTLCKETIEDRYDGHIISVKGDGFLALFGYPSAHEDDTRRAVQAGLDLCRAIGHLSGQAQREVGEAMDVRVGIHRGLVFIDIEDDDVYGLAANLASRESRAWRRREPSSSPTKCSASWPIASRSTPETVEAREGRVRTGPTVPRVCGGTGTVPPTVTKRHWSAVSTNSPRCARRGPARAALRCRNGRGPRPRRTRHRKFASLAASHRRRRRRRHSAHRGTRRRRSVGAGFHPIQVFLG